ncbi:MAG: methionyl-tRNA formyltransferase [Alphaproteobacteria bacterium]|nr:methionyl-tRNA formyltransferase [Alphaproteobacteria bacterium]
MNIVFMGTPDFATPVLERLIAEHNVVSVYTKAPSQSGRGFELKKTPVHLIAEKNGIPVKTPTTLKDEVAQKEFAAMGADAAVVAAYGLILPQAVIEAFKFGCLNVHASLLPRWRGAAPIQRAIEAGDEMSGITIMQIVSKLDAGKMYAKKAVPITNETTGGSLHDTLAKIGADLMSDVLKNINDIKPVAQDENLATYAKKLEKGEEKLDFNMSAACLERKIRAFNPYPATYFEHQGERFKVLRANVVEKTGKAGEILEGKNALIIACKEGALEILEIQRQGKRAMSTPELLRGFCFEQNTLVGA